MHAHRHARMHEHEHATHAPREPPLQLDIDHLPPDIVRGAARVIVLARLVKLRVIWVALAHHLSLWGCVCVFVARGVAVSCALQVALAKQRSCSVQAAEQVVPAKQRKGCSVQAAEINSQRAAAENHQGAGQ